MRYLHRTPDTTSHIDLIIFWINHDFDEDSYIPKYLQSFHLNISWRVPARSDAVQAARAVRAAAAVVSNAVQFHRGLTATLAHVQLGCGVASVVFDAHFKLDSRIV